MSSSPTFEWELSPTIWRFMQSSAFARCIVGPIGSGKSTGAVAEILRRSLEQEPGPDGLRRTRWAVIRNTYGELRDTTRKTFEQWLSQTQWDTCAKWREAENALELCYQDIRAEVLFRALDRPDDVRKLLSLELTGAWVNEAKEIPKGVFDMLQGRVGRYPSKAEGGPTWFGVWMDTNPPDLDHWIPKVFEEQRLEGFEVFHQPSGLDEGAENVENLPPGYYRRLVAGKSEDWVNVYVRGQYGFVKDGKPIYPEWNDTLHAVEVAPRSDLDIVIGQDFGLTPAATLMQRDPTDGQLQVFAELVSDDMGAVSFARELATLIKAQHPGRAVRGWGDPAGEQRSQVDERTPFQVVRAQGLPISPAPTNDFTLRREAVAGLLSRLTLKGRPALVVSPTCRTLRKAMAGGYCYRRLQVAGDERYHDKPDKGPFSHVAEALQYACVGEGEDKRAVHGAAQRRVHLHFKVNRAMGR